MKTTREQLMAMTSTLKENLILSEEAKGVFVDLLMAIDFKNCDNDMETLQLFFKRVYSGIEELKKRNKELSKEIELLKLPENKEAVEISPLESLLISENLSRN